LQDGSISQTPSLASLRLYSQHIAGTPFETPGEVVRWLGAVQAQDYLGALWAVGLRTRNAAEQDIEAALANHTIVRTWPMRGTLHFVPAEDARWMLELLARRVMAGSAARLLRQFALDEVVYAGSRDVFIRELQGGKQLTRNALYQALEAANISTANSRGLHILGQLAQEGLICFGPRQGKQQTIVLLDEWVPGARRLERDEALAELARRYFTSHGPATLQDFMWWSGLTAKEALAGLEEAKTSLVQEVFDDQTYWLSPSVTTTSEAPPAAVLLPAFDEYTVAYKDRRPVTHPSLAKRSDSAVLVLNPVVVMDGLVIGNWKRTLKKNELVINLLNLIPLAESRTRLVTQAAGRYAGFLGQQLRIA